MSKQDLVSNTSGLRPKPCRVCGGKGKVPGAEAYPPRLAEKQSASRHDHAPEYNRNPALGKATDWVTCSRCEGTGVYPPDTTGERERFYH